MATTGFRATGIVRRVDELGRIVIPREIRNNMGIKEGDPLEIFTSRDGEILMKKYEAETIREARVRKALESYCKTLNLDVDDMVEKVIEALSAD